MEMSHRTSFFIFSLEYIIIKGQKIQVGHKLHGTYLLLLYPHDVNLQGDNIDIIKKNTQTLIDTSKEVSLEVILPLLSLFVMSCAGVLCLSGAALPVLLPLTARALGS
jgi:hypothetical protein